MNNPNRLIQNYNNSTGRAGMFMPTQPNANANVSIQSNQFLKNNPSLATNVNMNQAYGRLNQPNQPNQSNQPNQLSRMEIANSLAMRPASEPSFNMNLNHNIDNAKIRESVIKPIKIERNPNNKQELDKKLLAMEAGYYTAKGDDYGPAIKECWKERNNAPYKIIIKNPEYLNKKYANINDLVVHKVTEKDKDKEQIDKSYGELSTTMEKHNNELKTIYSLNNETEHKKKFEYNHVYKYRMTSNGDSKGHSELKDDKIKYYKDLQKKEETGRKANDDILESLLSNGIFDSNDLAGVTLGSATNVETLGPDTTAPAAPVAPVPKPETESEQRERIARDKKKEMYRSKHKSASNKKSSTVNKKG